MAAQPPTVDVAAMEAVAALLAAVRAAEEVGEQVYEVDSAGSHRLTGIRLPIGTYLVLVGAAALVESTRPASPWVRAGQAEAAARVGEGPCGAPRPPHTAEEVV